MYVNPSCFSYYSIIQHCVWKHKMLFKEYLFKTTWQCKTTIMLWSSNQILIIINRLLVSHDKRIELDSYLIVSSSDLSSQWKEKKLSIGLFEESGSHMKYDISHTYKTRSFLGYKMFRPFVVIIIIIRPGPQIGFLVQLVYLRPSLEYNKL